MTRSAKVLVLFTVTSSITAAGAFQAKSRYELVFNGTQQAQSMIARQVDDGESGQWITSSTHNIVNFGTGIGTISVVANVTLTSGSPPSTTLNTYDRTLSYVILGN